MLLFTRPEDSQQAWADSKVVGRDKMSAARAFFESSFERPHTETTKEAVLQFRALGRRTRLA